MKNKKVGLKSLINKYNKKQLASNNETGIATSSQILKKYFEEGGGTYEDSSSSHFLLCDDETDSKCDSENYYLEEDIYASKSYLGSPDFVEINNPIYEKYKGVFPSQYKPELTYATKLAIINYSVSSFNNSNNKFPCVKERLGNILNVGNKIECFLYSIVDIERNKSKKIEFTRKNEDIVKFSPLEIELITNKHKTGIFNKLNHIEIKSITNYLEKEYKDDEIIKQSSGFPTAYSYVDTMITDQIEFDCKKSNSIKNHVKKYFLDSSSCCDVSAERYDQYLEKYVSFDERNNDIPEEVSFLKPLKSRYPGYESLHLLC